MLQLLLKGISGEISRFNKEILICLLESRFVVVVVVLVLWLLYIYIYIYNIQICIQFYNLQQLLTIFLIV